ncbi:MAG: c-type cytochrome biogenesis protein CcsB [Candidatus Eutrophobiaceae bacterium]
MPSNRSSLPLPAGINRDLGSLVWGAIAVLAPASLLVEFGAHMTSFEIGILLLFFTGLGILGHHWRHLRAYALTVAALTILALFAYGDGAEQVEHSFFLKYLLGSQAAISWMSALFCLSTIFYILHLVRNSALAGQLGTGLCWAGAIMGLTGMLVRWRESWLLGSEIGHIPISNLYEVFILFCVTTTLLYLYWEQRHSLRGVGAFVMLIVTAAVGFILWYSQSRGAHQIQPLVPALQSYWMKIHVPANFIGYGCFSIAAMSACAWLAQRRILARRPDSNLLRALPGEDALANLIHKSIALGFSFFTLATILGALWAAEAWGGYWSWDPKETWALIVWLNYAAWLHMRMYKGWQGEIMAWWAIIGLLVTLFAFLGVNMFLSGLHSYGTL